MRIVCPYTESGITQATRDSLKDYSVNYCLMDTETSYSNLMANLWFIAETFCIVEHDIAPWPGAIEQLKNCPSLWCKFPYRINGGSIAGLGCCKFDRELIHNTPNLLNEVNLIGEGDRYHPPGHWCALDLRLTSKLHQLGYSHCEHGPGVEHVNHWQSHRCYG